MRPDNKGKVETHVLAHGVIRMREQILEVNLDETQG